MRIPLIALLALAACTNNTEDSGDTGCQVNCLNDTGTPPATVQVYLNPTELGAPVAAIKNADAGDNNVQTIDIEHEGDPLLLVADVVYTLSIGDLGELTDDGVPCHKDAGGTWVGKQLVATYDALTDTVFVQEDVAYGYSATVEHPVVGGQVFLDAPLRWDIDLDEANCHYTGSKGWENDYPQDNLAVMAGFQFQLTGLAYDGTWIEMNESNELVMVGDQADRGMEITASEIDQIHGTLTYSDSNGGTIACD